MSPDQGSPGTTARRTKHSSSSALPEEGAGPAAVDADLSGLAFSEAKKSMVERFERDFLLAALRRNGGNISRTAESIGMVRQSLQQKIRELGLRSEDWTNGD